MANALPPLDFNRPGRMTYASKSLDAPRDHVHVFNANVCVRSRGKVWYGDLNLTLDADVLKQWAKDMGETIYILRERDARFDNEQNPKFENAVASVQPDGTFIPGPPGQ